MKKEILTHDKIKHDLDCEFEHHTDKPVNVVIFAVISVCLIPFCFVSGGFLFGILATLFVLITIIALVRKQLSLRKQKEAPYIRDINVVKSKLSSIVIDTAQPKKRQLVSTAIGKQHRIGHRNDFYTEYILTFGAGEWRIRINNELLGPTYMLYTWSKEYNISLQGLENISSSGDEFFVVIDENTQNVIYAYPAKFFECDTDAL